MRKALVALVPLAVMVLAGCSSSEGPGETPPPPKPITQEDLDKMPPEARARASQAAAYGQAASAAQQGQATAARGGGGK